MKSISKKNAMKVFWYQMAIDEVNEEELDKFNEIGAELDQEFLSYKDDLINECKSKYENVTEDRIPLLQECVDEILYREDEKVEDKISVRMLVWNLLVMANTDGEYSGNEKNFIQHVVRVSKLDKSVFMEMEQTIKTASAIEKELEYLQNSQKPYAEIRPLVEECENRRRNIVESISALITDEIEEEVIVEKEAESNKFAENAVKVKDKTVEIATDIGRGATVKAGVDQSKAKSLNKQSNERMDNAALSLEDHRKKCGKALQYLGEIKTFVLNNSMTTFVNSFSRIKNIDFSDSVGLEELDKIHIDQKDFEELSQMTRFSASLVQGGVAGVAGGALTALGAYSVAGALATASTGTAIASLSGVVGSNATLAFFGGGSLATGGMGMAGGTAVLGGLVAGPALLVMGIITGTKAGKSLEEAKANVAKADEICKELEVGAEMCIAIRRRSYIFYNLMTQLDAYFVPLIDRMNEILEKEGEDYSKYATESKKSIAAVASMAVSIKAVLDTSILSESGELCKEAEGVMKDTLESISSL